jgi:acyl-CoA thioester hydrolase
MDQPATIVKEPETLVPIRFQDCDPFGHLNNARYIDYFLNARMDHLLQVYGVNIYDRSQPFTASWVITKNQIAYLRPALLAEEVRIRTRLIHFTESAIVVEGLMLDKDLRHLKALLWVEFAYVNVTTGRPTSHPEHWMSLLRSVAIDSGYDPNGFNQRVEQARQQLRQRAQ